MAGLAVVVAALAGCSEPEQPSTTLPTATSTSAAAATLEPLGPADFPVPDEAREQTEAGALAMAQYYIELTSRSTQTLDPTWMRQLSVGCDTCESLSQSYDLDRADGNQLQGCELSISSYSGPYLEAESAEVPLVIDQQPCLAFGPDGQELSDRALPIVQLSGGLTLQWSSAQATWLISQLSVERA